jgi:4-hydroxybenzoate polyprenyltransferase
MAVVGGLKGLLPSDSTTGGYLFWLSRPRFWLYLAGPALVGAIYAAGSVSALVSPLVAVLIGYFLVPANVFLYGVNDIFDREVDEENRKKEEGPEVRFQGSTVVVAAVVLSGVLAVGFVPVLPVEGQVALGAFLFLAVEYSAPPLRFKTTPLLDSVSNGLYLLPAVVAYAAVANAVPPELAVAGGWLWTMAMHTFSAIPDIEPDREAGIRTTATVLGETRTYAYCGVVWLLAAGTFAIVHPLLGAVLAVYPVFVTGVALTSVSADRAYWWFPALNTVVGMTLSLGGLWGLLHGW